MTIVIHTKTPQTLLSDIRKWIDEGESILKRKASSRGGNTTRMAISIT